jgi:hypothetical protein
MCVFVFVSLIERVLFGGRPESSGHQKVGRGNQIPNDEFCSQNQQYIHNSKCIIRNWFSFPTFKQNSKVLFFVFKVLV